LPRSYTTPWGTILGRLVSDVTGLLGAGRRAAGSAETAR
jgi:hypothetical protein